MAKGMAGLDVAPCVNAGQFEAMKTRFRDVGDCLTDEQLLELADCYHEILRWRRDVRHRHMALMSAEVGPEKKSFADRTPERSTGEEAQTASASRRAASAS